MFFFIWTGYPDNPTVTKIKILGDKLWMLSFFSFRDHCLNPFLMQKFSHLLGNVNILLNGVQLCSSTWGRQMHTYTQHLGCNPYSVVMRGVPNNPILLHWNNTFLTPWGYCHFLFCFCPSYGYIFGTTEAFSSQVIFYKIFDKLQWIRKNNNENIHSCWFTFIQMGISL